MRDANPFSVDVTYFWLAEFEVHQRPTTLTGGVIQNQAEAIADKKQNLRFFFAEGRFHPRMGYQKVQRQIGTTSTSNKKPEYLSKATTIWDSSTKANVSSAEGLTER